MTPATAKAARPGSSLPGASAGADDKAQRAAASELGTRLAGGGLRSGPNGRGWADWSARFCEEADFATAIAGHLTEAVEALGVKAKIKDRVVAALRAIGQLGYP